MIALHSRRTAWSTAAMLLRTLASIAARDPLHNNASHCDGAGYIALWRTGQAWEIEYHRYDAGEDSCAGNLEHLKHLAGRLASRLQASEESLLILHARKASPGNPRGPSNAHPFNAKAIVDQRPLELYLAHNGSLDKNLLARATRIEATIEEWVDSHLYTIHLARKLTAGAQLPEILDSSKNMVETAMNVAILAIHGGRARLYFYSYINPELGKEKRDYYTYYLFRSPGMTAVAPSSLLYQAGHRQLSVARIVGLVRVGEARL